MPKVIVRIDELAEVAMRRLRRIIDKDGAAREARQKSRYVKPSEKRKLAKAAAVKRVRKQLSRARTLWKQIKRNQDRR